MKFSVRFLLFLVLPIVPGVLFAQARSDYRVTQDFERESQAILRSIESANTVVDCVDAESRIVALEDHYRRYKALLDRALYPDGFEGRIMKLRGQISFAKGKISIVEEHYARISELEARVRELSGAVERLGRENSAMLEEVKRLSSSKLMVDSLRALVVRLRRSLHERDQLVFSLIDSLFLQYDKDPEAMTDREKRGMAARMERKDVFANIKKSISDNVGFLRSTELTGSDIAELLVEQREFASKWEGFGQRLSNIYAAGKTQGAREIAAINGMMTDWEKELDSLFWTTLSESFSKGNIPVEAFETGEGFVSNLTGYLDEEIHKARDEKDGQRYFRYQAFADSLWFPQVEVLWIPTILKNGKLAEQQIEAVRGKIEEWEDIVSPQLTLVYIVIGGLMLVVVLYLYRRFVKTRQGAREEKRGKRS